MKNRMNNVSKRSNVRKILPSAPKFPPESQSMRLSRIRIECLGETPLIRMPKRLKVKFQPA